MTDRRELPERIIVGSDHAGLAMKYELLAALAEWGVAAEDIGVHALGGPDGPGLRYDEDTGTLATVRSADYPDVALAVARRVAAGSPALGLLICGSGIGVCIAANKVRGVRAALAHDPYSARVAREHNDANVICVGGRIVGPELAKSTLLSFLSHGFAGGRHQRRVQKIADAER